MPKIEDNIRKIALVINGDTNPDTKGLHQENVDTSTSTLLGEGYEVFVVSLSRPKDVDEDHYLEIGRDNIARMFDKVRGRLDDNDFFVVYVTGHGDKTGPVIGNDILPIASLKQYLDELPSYLHISFDTCYGGTFVNELKDPKRFLWANTPKNHSGFCKYQAMAFWSNKNDKEMDVNSDGLVTLRERALYAQKVSSEHTDQYAFTLYEGEDFNDRGLSVASGEHAVVEIGDVATYRRLTADADEPVIMIIGDVDCPACRKMEKALPETLAGIKTGDVSIYKTNCKDVAEELGITVVPAVLFRGEAGAGWTRAPVALADEVGVWIKRIIGASREKLSLKQIESGLMAKDGEVFLENAVRYTSMQYQSPVLLFPSNDLKNIVRSADHKNAAKFVEMLVAVSVCVPLVKELVLELVTEENPDIERIKAFLKAVDAAGDIEEFKTVMRAMIHSKNPGLVIYSLEFMNSDNIGRYEDLRENSWPEVRVEFAKRIRKTAFLAEREKYLMELANDVDEDVRAAALSGLESLNSDGVFEALLNALKNDSVTVKRAAAQTLSKSYWKEEQMGELPAVLKKTDDAEVLKKLLLAVRLGSNHISSDVKSEILKLLRNKIASTQDEKQKALLYYSLHRFGEDIDMESLKTLFSTCAGGEERLLVALILSEKGESAAIKYLRDIARTNAESEYFEEVIEALSKSDLGVVHELFIEIFNDRNISTVVKSSVMSKICSYTPEELTGIDKDLLKKYTQILFKMGMFAGPGLRSTPEIILRTGDRELLDYLMEQCRYVISRDPFIVTEVLGALSYSSEKDIRDFIIELIRKYPSDVLLEIRFDQNSPYIDEYVMAMTEMLYSRHEGIPRDVAEVYFRALYEKAKSSEVKGHVLKYMSAAGLSNPAE